MGGTATDATPRTADHPAESHPRPSRLANDGEPATGKRGEQGPESGGDLASRWRDALPRPVAFVFSGGASFGAVHVGMLQALAGAGIDADMVVGTSVGSLNGAALAEHGSVSHAADVLDDVWRRLRTSDVFPGGVGRQAVNLLLRRTLFSNRGLRTLITDTLGVRRFEQLMLPLTVLAAEARTSHPRILDSGPLLPALLASTAIPGVFPPVEVDGSVCWDGGTATNVPLAPAVAAGGRSFVVLDAGDVCHLDRPPRPIPDGVVLAVTAALRQRVLVEAPLIARTHPVLYLPGPCASGRSPLDLDYSGELIDAARGCATRFLSRERPPAAGRMTGGPHSHPGCSEVPSTIELMNRAAAVG